MGFRLSPVRRFFLLDFCRLIPVRWFPILDSSKLENSFEKNKYKTFCEIIRPNMEYM